MANRIWMCVLLVLQVAVLGCSQKAGPEDSEKADAAWMTDFEAAKQKAAEEGKDLLVNFSGSDWCYWCKRLDNEVFSRAAFVSEADKWFVFVLIDFPRGKSQPSQVRTQNKRLAEQLGIRGYPTIVLMRAEGTPYAETGYVRGGAKVYLTHLQELKSNK